jgi:hypothetical protein
MSARIVSIAVSRKKGTRKTVVEQAELTVDHGLVGDAHAGPGHRQVSLLPPKASNGPGKAGWTWASAIMLKTSPPRGSTGFVCP